MGVKVVLLFLVVLGICWLNNVDARNPLISDLLAKQVKDERICALCDQYATLALGYLDEVKTQKEIVDTLHLACSHLKGFKHECKKMVDYYVPLFFLEVAKIEPGEFCSKLNLCDSMAFSSENACTFCHEAVAEVLAKLDDPDAQLEIIEILLKVCEKSDKYAKKCKRLVFEYGPLILSNAEKYLVKNDLCTTLHACKASADGSDVTSSSTTSSLFAES